MGIINHSIEFLEESSPEELGEIISEMAFKNIRDYKYIKKLIKFGADLNIRDNSGNTSLFWSVKLGNDRLFKLLTDYKDDIIPDIPCFYGNTPLHQAAYHNYVDMVRSLIKLKANLNATNYDGWTPLHYAVIYSRLEIVNMLLEAGASKDFLDYDGWTPWDLAMTHVKKKFPQLNPDYNG